MKGPLPLAIVSLAVLALLVTETHACTNGTVRLVGGSTIYDGRVEVCINNAWGTVCDGLWSSHDATVVCRQLGYATTGSGVALSFGKGTGQMVLDDVQCSGSENQLLACMHTPILNVSRNCSHDDAGVRCEEPCTTGQLRLAGGNIANEGRVEMCINNDWGTLCDDSWGSPDATVVCRQLGYSTQDAVAFSNAHFGAGTGSIYFDVVGCTGSESNLTDCPRNPTVYCKYGHSEDAGVRCQVNASGNCTYGDVRLVGGSNQYEGRVEVCINDQWGTVCSDSWNSIDAEVVCKQLGYATNRSAVAYSYIQYSPRTRPIYLVDVACTSSASQLLECSSGPILTQYCPHSEDAGVGCKAPCTTGEVQLAGGNIPNEGRVEICMNNQWRTVCGDTWGTADATVVCRQLGYSTQDAVAFSRTLFGAEVDQIYLDGVGCNGSESNLTECSHSFTITCSWHSRSAGVRCQVNSSGNCTYGDVRLVGGSNQYEGRVEVCINDQWGTVCDDTWDSIDATVVCKQLGYTTTESGVAYSNASFGAGTGPIYLDDVACTSSDSQLLECISWPILTHYCNHSEDAGVGCKEQPIHTSSATPTTMPTESTFNRIYPSATPIIMFTTSPPAESFFDLRYIIVLIVSGVTVAVVVVVVVLICIGCYRHSKHKTCTQQELHERADNEMEVVNELPQHPGQLECLDQRQMMNLDLEKIELEINVIKDRRKVVVSAAKQCNPNIQITNSETPLHIAVRQRQTDIVIQLLSCGECNSNAKNGEGDTPLHIACYRKSLDIIKVLLEMRCSTNISNKKGETAQDIPLNEDGDCLLHIACQWGDVNIVRYIITNERCNLNIQGAYQNTPLHIACYNKSLSIIRLFIQRRCSTNIPNKKGETVQDIPLNENGDCLLHIACQWGDVDIVKYLVTNERCNMNISNCNWNTPLHIACYRKSFHIIRLLLEMRCSTNIPNKKGETAQDIPLNTIGDCLLHIACEWGDVDIVKYLIIDERCNPSVRSSTSKNTPLHIAVNNGQSNIIVELLSHCDPNVQNMNGDTPLHIAVVKSKVPTISKLLGHQQCNINVQNMVGDTPLHIAVKEGKTALVFHQNDLIAQVLSGKGYYPNVQNNEGDTLLHIAVTKNITPLVSQLLTLKECNPNVQNNSGDVPLHIAARDNMTIAISQLLTSKQCNPNVQNKDGDTPLHIAVRKNRMPIISKLLTHKQCNPNVLNSDHLTPLLIAIKHNNSSAATALLHHNKCDPTLRDLHGNTPLHLACIAGETQPEMVKVAKQLLTFVDVDPSCVNNVGQTPIELTTNYQLIQAISYFAKCKTQQSVQTYINMFIVGNPETGKSTLVKAICKEAGILWKIIPKKARRVKNVPLHTAGIIPTTFRSKTFGNTVLYDLAGQVEYYTSHAAVIQSTVISTPPAFIIVVNLSESEEVISQTLRYWWSFIDNHAARSSAPPQVILVGSHADVVKSTGRSVQEKMTNVFSIIKQLSASFHFAGQVALDCRDPASRKLQLFCSLVNQSCTVLRKAADVDLRCHVLYAFLLERFKGTIACRVLDVGTSVKENRELLPQNPDSLIPLLTSLRDKGLILLVKGGESLNEDWWIILQKQALLNKINGVIFAPRNFTQHKDLSWSTGVVPFSKLKNQFPDYNPNVVSGFLTHLEFCFNIKDHEILAVFKDVAEDPSPDVSEEYYFFPALVSVENPLHVWEQNDDMCIKCGWFYHCIQHDQFLSTQFLHVLMLRLAFTFALKLDPGDCCHDSLTLRRKCSVWKHGIAWLNRVSIETVVEVGLQHQSVIVMMRCTKGKEAKCVQLRSEVIQKVLEAKDEHCKAVRMSESFINPTDVKYPFSNKDVKFYSLTEIARGIMCKEEEANALDHGGRSAIPVQDLLLLDPCNTDTNTQLVRELFSGKHSMDETVRTQVLKTLNTTPKQAELQAHLDTKPTLPELIKFTFTDGTVVNILVEIALKFSKFGTFLLDDTNGSRVKIMARKHHYDAEQINTEIIQEWLTGRGKHPVSWTTLVEVLRDIELSTLAGEIEAVKCSQGQSQRT